MRHVSFALFCFSLVALAGCSSMSVTSDYDPSADFSGLKTNQWVKLQGTGDALDKAPLLMKRVMIAVDKALVAKGYSKVDSESPDFYVAVHAGVKDKYLTCFFPLMYIFYLHYKKINSKRCRNKICYTKCDSGLSCIVSYYGIPFILTENLEILIV